MASRPSDYFFFPDEVSPGNRIALLCDGPQVFPAVLAAIEGARSRLALEFYLFDDDATGRSVRDALARAALRGCNVRLIYDSIGSIGTNEAFFAPLKRAGGEVFEYHPIRSWRLKVSHMSRRDHRKILLADADLAIVGGFNIADAYARDPTQGGIHDLAVSVRGPAVAEGWNAFERTWARFLPARPPFAPAPPAPGNGPAWAQIAGSDHYFDRWRIRRTLLHALAAARSSIDLINPYFLPAPDVLRALRRAVHRGVRVRLLVPRVSDVRAVDLASLIVQRRLTRRGVAVYRWPGLVHAKAVVVDGVWLSVGSYNFDYQSLFRNLEAVANAHDPSAAAELAGIFEADVAISEPVTRDHWESLTGGQRLLARALYRLRRFL